MSVPQRADALLRAGIGNEVAVARWGCDDRSVLGAAVLIGALSAGCVLIGAMPARAGFLDFLFGAQPQQPSSQVSSYAAPTPLIGRVAPPPMGSESVRQGNEAGGRGVA